MTTKTKCIDSGSQLMIPAKPGDSVPCGNCGTSVPVIEIPLRPNDPTDHNTIRVLANH